MIKMKKILRKSQTILEYAAIAASLAVGLMMMAHYFNRSVQGKLKDTADSLGGQYFSSSFSIPMPDSGYRVSTATTNNEIGKLVSFNSNSHLDRSTTSFSYEGEKGFMVTTSSTHRVETGKIEANKTK